MQSHAETVLYMCPVEEFCLGESRLSNNVQMSVNPSNASFPSEASDVHTMCEEGHAGVMCTGCMPGYSMQLGQCTLCKDVSADNEEDASGPGVSPPVDKFPINVSAVRRTATRYL